MNKFKVSYIGLNNLFGQITSSLLRKSSGIRQLILFGEEGSTENGNNSGLKLEEALEGADVIIIGDTLSHKEKDGVESNGAKLVNYAQAIAEAAPNAVLVVATTPMNIMVPLLGGALDSEGVLRPERLLGASSFDTLRASNRISAIINRSELAMLPVIGGSSTRTRVALFSQCHPPQNISERMKVEIKRLLGTEQYNESETIERAFATAQFVQSVISGLAGNRLVPEITLSKISNSFDTDYLSLPVMLGRHGITKRIPLPSTLDCTEEEQLSQAISHMKSDAKKAASLLKKLKEKQKTKTKNNKTLDLPVDQTKGEGSERNQLVNAHQDVEPLIKVINCPKERPNQPKPSLSLIISEAISETPPTPSAPEKSIPELIAEPKVANSIPPLKAEANPQEVGKTLADAHSKKVVVARVKNPKTTVSRVPVAQITKETQVEKSVVPKEVAETSSTPEEKNSLEVTVKGSSGKNVEDKSTGVGVTATVESSNSSEQVLKNSPKTISDTTVKSPDESSGIVEGAKTTDKSAAKSVVTSSSPAEPSEEATTKESPDAKAKVPKKRTKAAVEPNLQNATKERFLLNAKKRSKNIVSKKSAVWYKVKLNPEMPKDASPKDESKSEEVSHRKKGKIVRVQKKGRLRGSEVRNPGSPPSPMNTRSASKMNSAKVSSGRKGLKKMTEDNGVKEEDPVVTQSQLKTLIGLIENLKSEFQKTQSIFEDQLTKATKPWGTPTQLQTQDGMQGVKGRKLNNPNSEGTNPSSNLEHVKVTSKPIIKAKTAQTVQRRVDNSKPKTGSTFPVATRENEKPKFGQEPTKPEEPEKSKNVQATPKPDEKEKPKLVLTFPKPEENENLKFEQEPEKGVTPRVQEPLKSDKTSKEVETKNKENVELVAVTKPEVSVKVPVKSEDTVAVPDTPTPLENMKQETAKKPDDNKPQILEGTLKREEMPRSKLSYKTKKREENKPKKTLKTLKSFSEEKSKQRSMRLKEIAQPTEVLPKSNDDLTQAPLPFEPKNKRKTRIKVVRHLKLSEKASPPTENDQTLKSAEILKKGKNSYRTVDRRSDSVKEADSAKRPKTERTLLAKPVDDASKVKTPQETKTADSESNATGRRNLAIPGEKTDEKKPNKEGTSADYWRKTSTESLDILKASRNYAAEHAETMGTKALTTPRTAEQKFEEMKSTVSEGQFPSNGNATVESKFVTYTEQSNESDVESWKTSEGDMPESFTKPMAKPRITKKQSPPSREDMKMAEVKVKKGVFLRVSDILVRPPEDKGLVKKMESSTKKEVNKVIERKRLKSPPRTKIKELQEKNEKRPPVRRELKFKSAILAESEDTLNSTPRSASPSIPSLPLIPTRYESTNNVDFYIHGQKAPPVKITQKRSDPSVRTRKAITTVNARLDDSKEAKWGRLFTIFKQVVVRDMTRKDSKSIEKRISKSILKEPLPIPLKKLEPRKPVKTLHRVVDYFGQRRGDAVKFPNVPTMELRKDTAWIEASPESRNYR